MKKQPLASTLMDDSLETAVAVARRKETFCLGRS